MATLYYDSSIEPAPVVVAGNPPADLSAQVAALQAQVVALQAKIDAAKAALA